MSQLDELRVFIRITEAGSITKAADQLGIAKSAVSRRLADLEKRMGATLITRTTRKFNLTEAGHRCYEHAIRVVDVLNELNAAVAQEEQEINGPIRMSIPNSFALNHMVDVIDLFLLKYPGIKLDLDLSDRFVDIVESGLDLAIRIGELKDSSLKARKIAPIYTRLAASPEYLNRHGRPETVAELSQHPFLLYGVLGGSALKLTDENGKTQVAQYLSSVTVNNGDFLHELAIRGHGVVLTPTFISWQAIKRGELEIVLPKYSLAPRHAYALYPNTRYLPKRVRLFIDFLVEYFGENPYWDEV